ncbi:MAG TPA: hypothetical protein VGN65_01315 [Casimicrobiaceae bacterium]|jgi:hypothetical protein
MLSESQYLDAISIVQVVVGIVEQLPLEEMSALLDRCQTHGSRINADAYARGEDSIREDRGIVAALSSAKSKLLDLRKSPDAPAFDEELQRDVDVLLGIRKPYSVELNDSTDGDPSRVVLGQGVV